MNNTFIRPYRIIPFDIGGDISKEESKRIIKKYNELNPNSQIQIQPIDKFHQSLSAKLIGGYIITDKILFFVYSFGVGVFSVQDNDFTFEGMKSKYAMDYCKSRRLAHKNILNNQATYSEILSNIMEFVRTQYKAEHEKIRISASPEWENKGLSYVMTVAYVNTGVDDSSYTNMSDVEKHSLQIMLTPSLAHEEDSEIIKLLDDEKKCDPYMIDLDTLKEPDNFWKSTNADIYISWAAVVVMQNEVQIGYIGLINSLEVDLQAMWFYTYCLYCNSKISFGARGMLASKLKHIENEFERQYNEFLNYSDSSCPQYVSDIRDELIRTSGIQEEHDKFVEHINFCIDETETLEREHQRKYAWLNESLLFIIAYADIVTTLATNFLSEMYFVGQITFVISAVVIFILGILFIIKKG